MTYIRLDLHVGILNPKIPKEETKTEKYYRSLNSQITSDISIKFPWYG